MQSLGEKITPILSEIENTLWEVEANPSRLKHDYSDAALSAATKIFMSVMMDKMWDMIDSEGMDQESRENMALSLGNEIRKMIKTYTGKDSFDFYK